MRNQCKNQLEENKRLTEECAENTNKQLTKEEALTANKLTNRCSTSPAVRFYLLSKHFEV